MDALIAPEGSLEILSRAETNQLRDAGEGGLYDLWRQCSLAILNSGSRDDDVRQLLRRYQSFRIAVVQYEGGIAIELKNAPDAAFVGKHMIRGIREHLFAVLRDLLFAHDDVLHNPRFDLATSAGITDGVFHILRNARVLRAHEDPRLVVCWGGHAIEREEYDYTKVVGYELGLGGLDICTGCGAGAMKGPMKGATVGHAKQRIRTGRYLGLTEPTIIAAESPNAIVNELVFPGGVGTAEEILYLLGILLTPENEHVHLPLVFTGPVSSRRYFERMHDFIGKTLGLKAQQRYKVILGDPAAVAAEVARGLEAVKERRAAEDTAYFFNWAMNVGLDFQRPFEATHQSMRSLELHRDQSPDRLALNLRRAFSGIVAGNVRAAGIAHVEKHGPFELHGDPYVIGELGALLKEFVAAGRMRLTGAYVPCYRIAV
jgi:pyrimidine/purine-5'-nucleotide nucleosidase